jgi:hypothetical protein
MAKKKKVQIKRKSVVKVKDDFYYVFATELGEGGFRIETDIFLKEDQEIVMETSGVEHGMVLLKLVPMGEVVKQPFLKPRKDA